jgi:hypothetical protein
MNLSVFEEFLRCGRVAQEEVDRIIEKAREAGSPGTGKHPREGGGKRLPSRSARPRKSEKAQP